MLPEPPWHALLPPGTRHPDRAEQLQRDAQAEWRRVVPLLARLGVLSDLDAATVIDYALCWALLRECDRLVASEGIGQRGERGIQKNPAVTAANQYRAQLRFYIAELGMSPAARTRLPQAPEDDPDSDLYDTPAWPDRSYPSA
jgi:P27 family predicted phage terminase small subunit